MNKCKVCFSLDEEAVGELERIAMSKGTSKSDVLENYLLKGLTHEQELTSIERYKFFQRVLNLKLDSILALHGTTQTGTILEKFEVAFISTSLKSKTDTVTASIKISEISLFETLEDIKEWDIDIFDKCKKIMAKFGRTKQRYLDLYPEKR